jgi:predicted permease
MDRVRQDLTLALRLLWKDRGFAATTVATLAICLAANAALFAVVNAVLLRPLPFDQSDRLVSMHNAYPGVGAGRGSNGVPDFYDRRQLDAFESVAIYQTPGVTVGGGGQGDPERVSAMRVSPSFFTTLGAEPAIGRVFDESEGEEGQHERVVLGDGLWQRLFSGRPDAVGETLRVNGAPFTVVGVMPPGFRFVNPEVQLWIPTMFTPADRGDDRRHSNSWQMIARLRDGVPLEQAQIQLDALNTRNLDLLPQIRELVISAGFHTPVSLLQDDLVQDARPTVLLLWGAALLVLVIGVVNVVNLASVRATTRARELVTRLALGATPGRLMQQTLTESFLLAAAGGAAGLALGWWGLQALAYLGVDQLPRGTEIALDGRVLGYTLGLVTVVAGAVGAWPALALRRVNIGQAIREEGRSGTPTRRARLVRRTLVTSQVAFAVVLLAGAGLLVASFERVLAVDPGFDPARVLTGTVSLPASRYPADADLRAAVERLAEGARQQPGVRAAGLTTSIPFGGSYSDSVIFAEGYQMAPGESVISPSMIIATPGYLEAMGVGLVAGRFLDERDTEDAARAVMVDERLARRFWPDQDPIGRRMYFPQSVEDIAAPPDDASLWMTVVGVVRPIRLQGLDTDGSSGQFGAYFLPYRQFTSRSLTFAVATEGDPIQAAGGLRAAVAAVDPELVLYAVRSMDDRVDRALVDRRTPMLLATGFAAVALLLSALGIYGVLAYQVRQRTREIGIRMALGAEQSSIFRMVAGEGGVIVGAGLATGLGVMLLLRAAIESQLFEVRFFDPLVLASVAGALTAVALVACLLPARRAARTDPVSALGL